MTRIQLVQGKAWTIPFLWLDSDGKAIDVSGATCRMQLRSQFADDDTAGPLLDLTEADGITLDYAAADQTDPNIVTVAGEDLTEPIPYGLHLAEWEINLGDGSERLALLEIEVLPEVVREVAGD